MATDPTGRVSHLPEMHRGVSWKQPVRVATTANITISTALNNGDTIDGVTLATGDRVLVKDQSSGAENGIYVVAASPTRDYDMDQDGSTAVTASEVLGAFLYVIAGTANGGKIFRATNTTAPTLGTTSITFTEFSGGAGGLLPIEGGQDTIKAHGSMGSTETFDPTDGNVHTGTLDANCTFTLSAPSGSGAATLEFWITQDGTGGRTITWPGSVTWDGGTPSPDTTAGVTVRYILESIDGGTNWVGNLVGGSGGSGSITSSGYTMATARLLGRTTASTGAIEEITVGSGLSLSAGSLTATGGSSPTIIRGIVAANATITAGTGFSVAHTGTGIYTITYDSTWAATPVVLVSLGDNSTATGIDTRSSGTSSVIVDTFVTGSGADSIFNFAAIEI